MRDLTGKVAVVTGAASGIGWGLAERFAREGMRVVLADVDEEALGRAEADLRQRGASVLTVRTDVSRLAEVEALAERAVAAFGAVHVVCNNAGVLGALGPLWELPTEAWEQMLGVNLWGVIHGTRVFVPLLLRQGEPGHVVNTASIGGLLTSAGMGTYHVTKHAVVALSEVLYKQLAEAQAPVTVSVLCPAWVQTGVLDALRRRDPQHAQAHAGLIAQLQGRHDQGTGPQRVAELVVEAIRGERLYVVTPPDVKPVIQRRMEDILAERNPSVAASRRAVADPAGPETQ